MPKKLQIWSKNECGGIKQDLLLDWNLRSVV